MIEILLGQLLLGIGLTICVFVIGSAILSIFSFSESLFFRIFVTNTIGITTILIVYALLKSEGKTILSLFLPIASLLVYFVKDTIRKPRFLLKEWNRGICWSMLFFLLLFIFQSYFYFDFTADYFKPLNTDNYTYAAFSDSLKLWGSENIYTSVNYFSSQFRHGVMPYHYPELWLTAVLSELFNVSATTTLSITVSAMLIGIYATGIASLFENIYKNKAILIILSLFILGLSGIFFPWFNTFQTTDIRWYSWVSIIGHSSIKFCFSYIYILLSLIIIYKGNKKVGLIILSLVPIISVGLLPGVWGGIMLYILSAILANKGKNCNVFYAVGSIVLFEILAYGIFYYCNGIPFSDNQSSLPITSVANVQFATIFTYLKSVIANIVVYSSRVMLFYIPFLFIFIFTYKYSKTNILLLLFALFSSAFVSTVSHGVNNAGQFSSNIGLLFVVIIVIEIATFITKSKVNTFIKSGIIIILICLIGFSFYRSIDSKKYYVSKVGDKSFCKNVANKIEKGPIIVFYNSEALQYIISLRDLYSCFEDDIVQIHQLKNITFLTVLGNPEDYLKGRELDKSDAFYYENYTPLRVWEKQKKGNNLESFIKQYSIKNIFIMGGIPIPKYIKKQIKSEIIAPNSGNRFILLQ